jgi:hypothetical protein
LAFSFSHRFNHILSKKIPTSIEEDVRMNGGGGANDSLLNESQLSRVNGHHHQSRYSNEFENLNGSVREAAATVKGATAATNDLSLHLNGASLENGSCNGSSAAAAGKSATASVHSPQSNGHHSQATSSTAATPTTTTTNGCSANAAAAAAEAHLELTSAKKTSSPLIKLGHAQNGHALNVRY